jgi:hypothetical protein
VILKFVHFITAHLGRPDQPAPPGDSQMELTLAFVNLRRWPWAIRLLGFYYITGPTLARSSHEVSAIGRLPSALIL